MKKITLKIDYSSFLNNDFKKYINDLKGVKSLELDNQNEKICIEYDSSIIHLNVLKMEILLYLDLKKIPSIIAFDKHDISNLNKYTIVIKDLCCEYCLKGMIEDLLEYDAIKSAYTDFNYIDKNNVNIFITYDDKILKLAELKNLENKFNNY